MVFLDASSPEDIYSYVINSVRDIIRALEVETDDDDDVAVQSEILAALSVMHAKVARNQEDLKASANWKAFTVALYGETNAGKSTIIEGLRLYFGEPTKVEQHRKFDALKASLGLDDTALQAIREDIESARLAITQAKTRIQTLEYDGPAQLKALEVERDQLVQQAEASRSARAWWEKLIDLLKLKKTPEPGLEVQDRITALQQSQQEELQQASKEQLAAEAAFTSAEDTLAHRLSAMPQLLQHADGAIIGDGSPDYTLANQRYTFTADGTSFDLLDVPGIEGDQGKVNPQIEGAVRTAHAVFYVTGKAARPQHGDKERGTLEKIKAHLGAQTEVWAVFNKRVSHPLPLRSKTSLFTRDAVGIADLDEGLCEALPSTFKGVLPVSAYPAFLALADRLAPSEALVNLTKRTQDKNSDRKLFMSEFDKDVVLDKSGFTDLANHLLSIAIDAPRKIKLANVYKVNQSLQDFVGELERHAVSMEAHAKKVITETKAVLGQVDLAVSKLGSSLRNDAINVIRDLETGVRKKVYALIEKGAKNDDLEKEMEAMLSDHSRILKEDVEEKYKASMTQFQNTITRAAKRFQKHLQELGEIAGSQMHDQVDPKFSLNLKVDNGVNVLGLVLTTIGTISLLVSNPAGWLIITFSVLGLVISLGKALWALVDSNFKKSQQRKAVDENLSKAVSELKKDLNDGRKSILDTLQGPCNDVKKQLGAPLRNIKLQASVLRLSTTRMQALITKIETEMV
ncbi:hypothetical protein [Luteimonas sp. A478]